MAIREIWSDSIEMIEETSFSQAGLVGRSDLQRRIEISVEKLREYRFAPILAAVTGKIDVRKEVA